MKNQLHIRALICMAVMVLAGPNVSGQVGIGVSTPDSSAILELSSDSLGFLPPRMTQGKRDSISNPAEGLLIYCTNCEETFYVYGVGGWQAVNTTDNLGNHYATQNIQLSGNYLSGDGSNEGVYVDNDGNVGLGYSSPSHDLDIYKSSTSVEQRIYSSSVDGVGHLLVGAAGGGHINLIANSSNSTYKGVPDNHSGIVADYRDMIFATGTSGNASEQMRLTTGGSLAIGTSSPEGAFDVMTGTTNNDMNIHFEETGTDAQKIIFQEANADYFSIHHDGSGANPSNKLTFQAADGNDGTLDVDVMTLLQSGYVGIGTTSPDDYLNIDNNGSSGKGISLDGTNPGIHPGSGGAALGYATVDGAFSSDASTADLVLRSDANKNLLLQSGSGSSHLFINSSGYIGAGTTSPPAHLTVYNIDQSVENFRIGRTSNENLSLNVQDINGYLTYNQDTDENNHDHHFFIRNNAQGTRDRTIQFQLNSDTELTIADEAIGVGTASPSAPLHVQLFSSGQTIDASKQQGLLIENSGSSTAWYALQTVTAAGVGLTVNNAGMVGIGVSVPGEELHVAGSIRMVDGNQSAGDILISDANGTGTWTDPSNVAGSMYLNASSSNAGAQESFANITSGIRNTSIGYQATNSLTTGNRNTAYGYRALYNISTDGDNTAIGSESMEQATSASSNTAVGSRTLQKIQGGDANVALGYQAGINLTTGDDNVFIGYRAGHDITTTGDNVFIGHSAGKQATGHSNVFIGYKAGHDETGNSKLYIENSDASTPLIGGDFSGHRVGINRAISDLSSGATFQVGGTASKSTSGSWSANSDRRLKTNIEYMDSREMLDQMLRMKGVSYEWNDTATSTPRPEGIQYGFIAQDIEEVWPSKITKDGQGYLMTAYGDYDPMFVESIRALHNRVIELKKQNADLRSKVLESTNENKTMQSSLDDVQNEMEELKSYINSHIGNRTKQLK